MNITYIFSAMMVTLFMISVITTVMYVRKIYFVLKYNKCDPEIYRAKAYPVVLNSKIWNFLLGVAHFMTCLVFLTNGGRVCSGWYLPSQRYTGFVTNPEDY